MEEEFYHGRKNVDSITTLYYLANQYSNLGQFEKALLSYEDVLGKKKKKKEKRK
jgi:hypothetical protein